MNTFPKHFLHFPKHPKKIWRVEGVLMTLLDDFLTTSSSSQALLLLVNHLALPLALQAQWPGPTAPHGSAPKHRDRMPMRGRCRIATDVEIWIAKPGMPSTWKILPRPRIGCCGTPDSGGHSGAGRCHRSNSVWQLSHPFGLRSQYVTVLHSAFVRKNHTFEYCVLCVFTLYTFYNLQHLVSVVCELGSLFSKQNKQSPRWQLLQFFPSFSSLAAGITEVHFFFWEIRLSKSLEMAEIEIGGVKSEWNGWRYRGFRFYDGEPGAPRISSKKRSFEFFHVTLRYLRPSD